MLASLVSDLNKLCDKQPFHTGWYLKDLRTEETADRRGRVVVPSASTRKIAIMMVALKVVNEGGSPSTSPWSSRPSIRATIRGAFNICGPASPSNFSMPWS